MIQDTRVQQLNDSAPGPGRYVLYWMQASCRAECNHALEYAIREANAIKRPVVACFGLTVDFPEANARHYTFLLEGLRDAQRGLARRGIPLVVRQGSPPEVVGDLARDACIVVTDRGYLRVQREWRSRVAAATARPLVQVESDVLVPVEAASRKEAYSAAVLRPRIREQFREYAVPLPEISMRAEPLTRTFESLPLDDVAARVCDLGVDASVPPVRGVAGGSRAAMARLQRFLDRGLARYHQDRNDPGLDGQSGLSPYLHFGHISPPQVVLAVGRRRGEGVAAFLEELVVRRELSMNFTCFNDRYDRYECLPAWCRTTLERHARDPRPVTYTPAQLERARTDDPYWNAAQSEMVSSGRMHGYMRMYWGKKLLEWSERPEDAYRTALRLNNKYELDGRDPNGFAGVAWCFGKHDRPWGERPVFGLVRYMNAAGLERKFDMEGYVRRVRSVK